MRRAIVHIGMPRTGTTTLQAILSRRRAELAANGILYPALLPATGLVQADNHQHLGEAFLGRRPAADGTELLRQLDRQLAASAADVAIISYESLCLVPRWSRGPRRLREVFGRHGFALETLLSVRPQSEYINARYTLRAQFLRETRPFGEAFPAEMRLPRLDYAALAAPWRNLSDGRLHAVPLRDRRSAAPLVDRVFGALGLSDRLGRVLGEGDRDLAANRSLGPVAVEVSRRLRAGGLRIGPTREAREVTLFIEEAARRRGLDARAFRGVGPDLRRRAEQAFAASNERFARDVWGSAWGERVADEPERPVNEIAGRPVDADTEAQVHAILAETCAHFGLALRSGPARALADGRAAAVSVLSALRERLRTLGG